MFEKVQTATDYSIKDLAYFILAQNKRLLNNHSVTIVWYIGCVW